MKILVTGGAGFVGSHLVKKFNKLGLKVYIVDNLLSSSKKKYLDKNYFYNKSITDKVFVNKIIKKVDVVYHLAAQVELQTSIINPEFTMYNNVYGSSNIIKNCVKYKKKLIFASSCSVYPLAYNSRIKENNSTPALSPYAMSKIFIENLINFYTKNNNLQAVNLRFFNIYGPNQNSNSNYSAVIPTFIKLAKKNKILKLNGGGYQKRDFIHIKDVVDLYIKMLYFKKSGTYNVGTGKATSIKLLAKEIIKIIGKGQIKNYPELKADAKYSCANIDKLFKDYDFKPRISISEGLIKTINNIK